MLNHELHQWTNNDFIGRYNIQQIANNIYTEMLNTKFDTIHGL